MKFKTKRLMSLMLALVMMMSLALTACGSTAMNRIPMTFTDSKTGQTIQAAYDSNSKTVTYSSSSKFSIPAIAAAYVGLSSDKYNKSLQILNTDDYYFDLAVSLSDPVVNGLIDKIVFKDGSTTSYYEFTRNQKGQVTMCSIWDETMNRGHGVEIRYNSNGNVNAWTELPSMGGTYDYKAASSSKKITSIKVTPENKMYAPYTLTITNNNAGYPVKSSNGSDENTIYTYQGDNLISDGTNTFTYKDNLMNSITNFEAAYGITWGSLN